MSEDYHSRIYRKIKVPEQYHDEYADMEEIQEPDSLNNSEILFGDSEDEVLSKSPISEFTNTPVSKDKSRGTTPGAKSARSEENPFSRDKDLKRTKVDPKYSKPKEDSEDDDNTSFHTAREEFGNNF